MTDAKGLEAALDRLYQCILVADFGDLPKILSDTERLTNRLTPINDTAIALRLRHKAHRNGLCLQAAARGLRAAQRRLGEMDTVSTQLSTYTIGGVRADLGCATGSMAKRL